VEVPGQICAPRVLVADDEDDIRALTTARSAPPDLAVLAEPFQVATLVAQVRKLAA